MSYVQFTYRPLDAATWVSDGRHQYEKSRFGSQWSKTMQQLDDELRMIGVRRAVIEMDVEERDIRNDGLPRSSARPASPRVRISFSYPDVGDLQYPCDTYDDWQDNIRAIVKTLAAQRAMDRYGATRLHQQYTGWKQLPEAASETMDVRSAAAYIGANSNGEHSVHEIMECGHLPQAYRQAAMNLHPDHGGTDKLFATLTKAKASLDAYHGAGNVLQR